MDSTNIFCVWYIGQVSASMMYLASLRRYLPTPQHRQWFIDNYDMYSCMDRRCAPCRDGPLREYIQTELAVWEWVQGIHCIKMPVPRCLDPCHRIVVADWDPTHVSVEMCASPCRRAICHDDHPNSCRCLGAGRCGRQLMQMQAYLDAPLHVNIDHNNDEQHSS